MTFGIIFDEASTVTQASDLTILVWFQPNLAQSSVKLKNRGESGVLIRKAGFHQQLVQTPLCRVTFIFFNDSQVVML